MHTSSNKALSYRTKDMRSVAQYGPSVTTHGVSSLYPGLSTPSPSDSMPLPQPPFSLNDAAVVPFDSNPTKASSSLLKGLNLESLKNMVQKMGGIQGIVENMNKLQKIIASVQQMGPMLKLLFSSFSNNKSQSPQLAEHGQSLASRRKRKAKNQSFPRKTYPRSRKLNRR